MKKNLVIAQHVNLFDEAFFLLYQWVNEGDLGKVRLKEDGDLLYDNDIYRKRFEILTSIFKDVTEQLKGKKERIDYYFKERNNEFSTFGSLALLWTIHRYDNKLISYEERFRESGEALRVKEFANIISEEESDNIPLEDLKTISDLIRFIEASPYEKDAKWEVIRIFSNQEASYNEVFGILKEVMEVISSKYSKQISKIEQDCYEYWSEFQNNNDITETINSKLNISWESDKETVIVPLLFLPYGVTISVTEPEFCSKDIIRISVMIDKSFIMAERKINKDDVVNVGKLLSDKSKVDILEFISKKSCYGKEIANELNLSTATISYHVNALLKTGFIKAEVISNKVYYSIDRERISTNLEDIKDYFTKL
jgi:DNA-binding transcriptional ArsR family regulator